MRFWKGEAGHIWRPGVTPQPQLLSSILPPHRRALRHRAVLPMACVLEESKEEPAYPQTRGINTPKPCLRPGVALSFSSFIPTQRPRSEVLTSLLAATPPNLCVNRASIKVNGRTATQETPFDLWASGSRGVRKGDCPSDSYMDWLSACPGPVGGK